MSSIIFVVPGEPQGKARPRVVRTRSGGSCAYTPDKTVAYEELVRVRCSQACSQMLQGELCAEITAFFAIPKSASKKSREKMASGAMCPTKKPDADNIAKIILDAINGIAYHDDSQIVELRVHKEYVDCDPQPRVKVRIWEMVREEAT